MKSILLVLIFSLLGPTGCERETEEKIRDESPAATISLSELAYLHMHKMYVQAGGQTLSHEQVLALLQPPQPVAYNYNRNTDGTFGGQWCTEGYVAALRMAGYRPLENTIGHKATKKHFESRFALIPISDLTIGDWLELDTNGDGLPNHAGMFVGWKYNDDGEQIGLLTLEANAHSDTFDYMLRAAEQIISAGCVNCL